MVIFVSISMLWFFTNAGNQSGRGGLLNYGSKQHPVTKKEYRDALTETRLLYFLNFKKWPEQDDRLSQKFDVEQQTYARLLRLSEVKEANIHVSNQAAGELARTIFGPNYEKEIDQFVAREMVPHGVTADDLGRFLRNDVALQQLGGFAGLSARLVTPREAEASYRREHQEVAADAVFFSPSNYFSKVNMAATAINPWYTNNMADFRIPERVRVTYADFSRSNFLAEAGTEMAKITNLNARLEEIYVKQGTNAFKDTNGLALSKPAALEKIKQEGLNESAARLAFKKANDFASLLSDMKTRRASDLVTEATKLNYKIAVTAPFDMVDGPTNLNVSGTFTRAAFSLTTNDPVSLQVLSGEQGFYVIALKENLPSENPPFESVRARVNEKYRLEQATSLARSAGTNFHAKVLAGLATGRSFTFTSLAETQKIVNLPRFSISTESLPDLEENINFNRIKQVAFQLEPGKASNYIPTSDGGFVLYIRSPRPLLDEAKLRAELPQFMGSMRYYRQNEIYSKWFGRELEKAGPPFNRPPGKRGVGSGPDDSN